MPEAPPLKEPLWWRYDRGRIVLPQEDAAEASNDYLTFVGRYGPYKVWAGTPGFRYVNSFRSKKGGFTRAALKALGVPYPLRKGWLRELAEKMDEKIIRGEEVEMEREFDRLLFRDD